MATSMLLLRYLKAATLLEEAYSPAPLREPPIQQLRRLAWGSDRYWTFASVHRQL